MARSMLPVLLLTTIALSSSDVIPIVSDKDNIQPFNVNDQEMDNIFSDNDQASNIPSNIFYYDRASQNNYLTSPTIREITQAMYSGTDNTQNVNDFNENINKEQNYDDEGYRKEQWHNYPRQLDRLHNSHYRYDKPDETVKSEGDKSYPIASVIDDFTSNEYRLDSSDGDRNVFDTIVAATNPYLVLKVQLTYLQDDIKKNDLYGYSNLLPSQGESKQQRKDEHDKFLSTVVEPMDNVVKIKREKPIRIRNDVMTEEDQRASETGNSSDRKTVKKRIFSLWSRLQSLSHTRGHELHHRRHLHAFYGMPDNNGNGVLTAQTRATFVRPPGSPLRWG